jgi:hypothetical protein
LLLPFWTFTAVLWLETANKAIVCNSVCCCRMV